MELKHRQNQVLFTRQRHEADRAGLHWDYRIVIGDKAYSWATKKELPEIGKSIVLWEQPIHTADYALRKRVVIPKGMYGSGVTTLDFVRKGVVDSEPEKKQHIIHIPSTGDRYLLKKLPDSIKGDGWLFKNLGPKKAEKGNLEKLSMLIIMYENKITGDKKWVPESKISTLDENWISVPGANKYMRKIAAQLSEQQRDALDKLETSDGLILDHSTGSGKTLTMLSAIERNQSKNPKSKALVIAPASLVSNIDKEIEKHKLNINKEHLTVLSYEKAVNQAEELAKKNFDIAVVDEAHKLRSVGTKRHRELSDIIQHANKRLLATGTTTYNHVSDISPLVNIAAGDKILPEGKREFEDRYVSKGPSHVPILQRILGAKPSIEERLIRKKELAEKLDPYIHRYDASKNKEVADKFPTKTEKLIQVEMSPSQERIYRYLEGKLPFMLRYKVRMNLPLDKKESASLNAFSTGIRQVSNSIRPFVESGDSIEISPKIQTAVSNLISARSKDKNFRGLVYSNFLKGGLQDYSEMLQAQNIPHSVYTGALSAKEKDALVEDYNSGKRPILLVSSSGAEGLNLKGTKIVQVLEPHFNKSKIHQVVSRGIRYESHDHLPADERIVGVEHYHSIFPKGFFGKNKSTSIDSYLHQHSESKNNLSQELNNIIENNQR